MTLNCPECGSDEILVYEETAWKINEFEYYCQTVKLHDSDAKARCQACNWVGKQNQLKGFGEQP